MRGDGPDTHARHKIPELDRVVLGATDDQVTDRVEDHFRNCKLVSTEGLDHLACGQVVHADDLVVTS